MRKALVLLAALCLSNCASSTGACVTHDLSGGGYWCDEDQAETACNADAAARVGAIELSLAAGQTCDEIGYGHLCSGDQMAASGGPAYEVSRLLSNASCDASKPADPSGGFGGGTGGGGTGGTKPGSCTSSYQGPLGYPNIDGFCQAAWLYVCEDGLPASSPHVSSSCDTYHQWQLTTSGVEDCPYCE